MSWCKINTKELKSQKSIILHTYENLKKKMKDVKRMESKI